MLVSRCSKALCWAAAVFSAAHAQTAPNPFIQSIFPRGGRQGSEVRIEIGGRNLGGATEIRVSGRGVACQILEASDSKVVARARIAPNAAAGRRDLRVLTPRGSFLQAFEIGVLPEQMEREPENDNLTASRLSLPVLINGKISAGDYDHFRFSAEAGQTLVFDLNSSRTGTRFDGVLTLLDATGRELAEQDDFYFDKDPHLAYRFTAAGEYVLRAWGFRESGSASAEYRLTIGELPNLLDLFPAGGRRGGHVEFLLAGHNLHLVEDFALDGEPLGAQFLEKNPHRLRFRARIPERLEPGYYPLRAQTREGHMLNPVLLAVSESPEIVLSEQDKARPLALTLPVLVNGRLALPRERHHFLLDVQAGEQITFQGDGMALGNFRVEMRDAGLRGRPDLIYRLRVSRSDPDFEVSTLVPQATIVEGGDATFLVRVRRVGGWNTAVEVWVEDAPPGVASQRVIAQPVNTRFRGTFGEDFFFDGTNIDVPLKAQEGAPAGAWPLRVKARGVMNGKAVERTAVVFHHWYQTGFLRGPTQEQQFILTVSKPFPNGAEEQRSESAGK